VTGRGWTDQSREKIVNMDSPGPDPEQESLKEGEKKPDRGEKESKGRNKKREALKERKGATALLNVEPRRNWFCGALRT